MLGHFLGMNEGLNILWHAEHILTTYFISVAYQQQKIERGTF